MARALLPFFLLASSGIACQSGPAEFLDQVQNWINTKNVDQLRRVVELPAGYANPLNVIRTDGVYGVGERGWIVKADGPHVVFSTPMTSEDVGEFLFRREGERLTYRPEERTEGTVIVRHDVRLRVLPSTKEVRLSNDLRVRHQARASWNFRLSPNYRVQSIQRGGTSVAFKQLGGVVLMPPADPGEATYRIEYLGKPDLPAFAGSINADEVLLTNDYWLPMVGRLPAPYALEARVPGDWITVAQGVRQEERVVGTESVTRWRMDLPVIYYSFSAGRFKREAARIGSRHYFTVGAGLTPRDGETQNQLSATIVDQFERLFGRWPFPGYGNVETPIYGSGALEAYSFATWGDGIPMEDSHEPAHTYFGGVINNTYLRSLWNESFAVYCEDLYRRTLPLGNRAARQLVFVGDSSPSPRYNTVSCAQGGAYAGPVSVALGYGKGAKVLQMLESIVGEEAMIKGMREWLQTHPKGKPGEWEDFERLMIRRHPDANLATFFRDWIHGTGVVDFTLREVRHEDGALRFRVEFTGPSLDTPVEVFADGKRVAVARLKPGENSVPLASRPKQVQFDPFLRVLRPKSSEELPATVARFRPRQVFRAPGFADHLPFLTGTQLAQPPANWSGYAAIGDPTQTPELAPLFELAGITVTSDAVRYGGQTYPKATTSVMAVVNLPGGGQALVGFGKPRARPETGFARTVITDEFGRFVNGERDLTPRGPLTFRL